MFFSFYTEIQDGHQKWRETNLWPNVPDDSVSTLAVKNFVQTNLCHSVSEINMFLHFSQKFKRAAKNGRKQLFTSLVEMLLSDIVKCSKLQLSTC